MTSPSRWQCHGHFHCNSQGGVRQRQRRVLQNWQMLRMQKASRPCMCMPQQTAMPKSERAHSHHWGWRLEWAPPRRKQWRAHACNTRCACYAPVGQPKRSLRSQPSRDGSRHGFSGHLSASALTRAIDMGSMYIARNKAIKIPFSLQTRYKQVNWKALLNSSATENFIHLCVVKQLELKSRTLKKPRNIWNVDGTINKGGKIEHAVTLKLNHTRKEVYHQFFVADIGPNDFIFGYPFLEAADPSINWNAGCISGLVTVSTENAEQWKILPKGAKTQHQTLPWVRNIPRWESGDEVWCQTIIRKTTVAQQLAEQATDQMKRMWQELVPERYHQFAKVFSEEGSEKFPDWRPWDHTIDLKPDAPMSINCWVYPLSPAEKLEQQKFLDQNLHLKRIRCSKSPYASGFFFIKKKDRKFRPVQDYWNLNKWTIPNKYPLSLIPELIHKISGKQWFTKFNARWGYNNVCIKEGDKWKAAFKTSDGLFEPTVMFFGLTNSPATFQTMMDDKLKEEINSRDVSVYMDDIVIRNKWDPRGPHVLCWTTPLKAITPRPLSQTRKMPVSSRTGGIPRYDSGKWDHPNGSSKDPGYHPMAGTNQPEGTQELLRVL